MDGVTKKRTSLPLCLAAIGGSIAAVLQLSYLLTLLCHRAAFSSLWIPLFLLLCLALPWVFRVPLARRLPKCVFSALVCIYAACAWFYLVTFAAFCIWLGGAVAAEVTPEASLPQGEAVLVVFGCRVERNTPSRALERRLARAAELLDAHPDYICVVSGGQGDDEGRSEAEVMADYLQASGISRARILTEETSRTTLENLRNTQALLAETPYARNPRIALSDDYHLPRIARLIRSLGGGDWSMVGVREENTVLYTVSLVREYFGFIKSFIIHG